MVQEVPARLGLIRVAVENPGHVLPLTVAVRQLAAASARVPGRFGVVGSAEREDGARRLVLPPQVVPRRQTRLQIGGVDTGKPLPVTPVRAVASRTATQAQEAGRAASAGAPAGTEAKAASGDVTHHGRVPASSSFAANTEALAAYQATDAGSPPLHYPEGSLQQELPMWEYLVVL